MIDVFHFCLLPFYFFLSFILFILSIPVNFFLPLLILVEAATTLAA